MSGSKKMNIAGWVICGLVGLFLLGPSALGKFVDWPGKEEVFGKMGFTTDMMFKIGILEVVLAILFLIPRTSFLGAILLTGYLGGATVTHLRVGELNFFAVVVGIVMWIGLALRTPEIFSLVLGTKKSNP